MKKFTNQLKGKLGWVLVSALIITAVTLQSCYSDMHSIATYIPQEDEVIVPLYFTPDGDGVKDYWMVQSRGDWDKFTVQVFNKRNQLIWQTEDPRDQGFSGTYVDFISGDTISTDIYFAFMVWAKEDGNKYFKDGVFINKLNEAETY